MMISSRERKLALSDPGRDAAGEELDRILEDAERATEQDAAGDDASTDSFLDRFRPAAPALRSGRHGQ